jgi:predicted ATPase
VEHIYRYLAGRFGAGCPVELAGAVHETTKGNAFMLASLVDCLVASASIVTDASGWRLKAGMPMTALSLTDVLREAIARRLESLDPAEREVLEAGALIGYEFKASSVANATANKIASARTLLDLVSRRGDFILTVSDDECRVSDPMYRFRHPSYPGVIADRAPWLRQIRVSAYIDQQPPTAMPRRNYRLLKRA